MIIRELILKNFGKFHNERIALEEGINVIYGGNEKGKSTIHTFLEGIFFGIRRKRGAASKTDTFTRFTPWENPAWYEGAVVFECDQKKFRLERDFSKPSREPVIFCETDGEKLSAADGDLDMLLGNISQTVYENTVSVGQMKSRTQEGLVLELRDYLAEFQTAGDLRLNPEKALRLIREKRREWEDRRQAESERESRLQEQLEYKIRYIDEESEKLREKIHELESRISREGQSERRTEKECIPQRNSGKRLCIYGLLLLVLGLIVLWVDISWSFLLLLAGVEALLELMLRKTEKPEKKEAARDLSTQERLKEQKKVLEENLSEKIIQLSNYREEAGELKKDTKEAEKIQKEISALLLAEKRLKEAAQSMQNRTGSLLGKKMSEIFSEMTEGKYKRVVIDDNFSIYLDNGEKYVEMHQISCGTAEQVYLALRMACADILCSEEELPMLLDETFAMYDDKRLSQTLLWLAGRKSQTIIFSCNKREIEALEKMKIPFHLVSL